MKPLIASLKHALSGLKTLIEEEPNYAIHLSAAALAIVIGLALRINPAEWLALILAIGLVLVIETLNTSIENIMDFISTKRQPQIKRIKDLAAAAVLIAAITAMAVGLIIFLPKIIKLLQ